MPIYLTKQFLRSIQNSPKNCILFAGAGLSVAGVRKGGGGLPTWWALIEAMIDDLKDSGKYDAQTQQRIATYEAQGDLLKIAELYKEKTRSDQYAAFLKEHLDPKDLCLSPLHEQILSIGFRGIITTNFDRVFEYNNSRLEPLIYPQAFENIDRFRQQGFFAKIHGCIGHTHNMQDDLVLSEASYQALRDNPKYQTILKSLFLLNQILTVGFSLTDPDFLSLIADLKQIFGSRMPTIYALIQTQDERLKDEWRERGVEIIGYKDHDEIKTFFAELKKLDEQNGGGGDGGTNTGSGGMVKKVSLYAAAVVAVIALLVFLKPKGGKADVPACVGWECEGSYPIRNDTAVSLFGNNLSLKKLDTLVVDHGKAVIKPAATEAADPMLQQLSGMLQAIADVHKSDDERARLANALWNDQFSAAASVTRYDSKEDMEQHKSAGEYLGHNDAKVLFLDQLAASKTPVTVTILRIVKDPMSGKISVLDICEK